MAFSNNSATVGVASTEIVPERTERVSLVLTNDADETIYLAIGAAAVMNKGIPLVVGEKLILETKDRAYAVINGICTSGGKNICIFEIYN